MERRVARTTTLFHVKHLSQRRCSLLYSNEVIIDWLSYSDRVKLANLELSQQEPYVPWQHMPGVRRFGFENVSRWQSVEAWEKEGKELTHIDASGKGCRDIETLAVGNGFSWQEHMFWLLETQDVKMTRLDVTIDVYSDASLIPQLEEAIRLWACKSRFNEETMMIFKPISKKAKGHGTIYMGATSSDCRMRIYDKKAEGHEKIDHEHTRIELQTRRDTAIAAAKTVAYHGDKGARDLINSYFRPLGHDGKIDLQWKEIMRNPRKRPIANEGKGGTVETFDAWVETDVMTAIGTYLERRGGDWGELQKLIKEARNRRGPRQRSMIPNK